MYRAIVTNVSRCANIHQVRVLSSTLRPAASQSILNSVAPFKLQKHNFHFSAATNADTNPPTTPSTPSTPSTPASPSPSTSSSTPTPKVSSSSNNSGNRNTGGRTRNQDSQARLKSKNDNMLQYLVGLAILVVGASWAAVPLYRAFCAHTGYGGTTQTDKDGSKLATLTPSKREITVAFNADVSPAMHWKFIPSQPQLKVKLGEPVLAFYKATNNREKAVTGVATYNVTPMKAGLYFHKIQCFCFDEQRLRAKETVDMPVFFYLDPAMEQDKRCDDITHLTLSYTFFPVEDDPDDTRTEEEKDAQMQGVRLHTNQALPHHVLAATQSTPITPPPSQSK